MNLSSPIARTAALGVTFEKLVFGDPQDRVVAYRNALVVARNTDDEKELNGWWRAVVRDARWKTRDQFVSEFESKIADITSYHELENER